jgi:hypothetical protein
MAVPKPPKTATNRDIKPERNKGVSKPVPLGGKMSSAKPKDKGSMSGAKAPAKKPMSAAKPKPKKPMRPAKSYAEMLKGGAVNIPGFDFGRSTQ